MPTIELNRKVFEKLVGKKVSDQELRDRISMLGTDLESIEGDKIIVEIFPDRPSIYDFFYQLSLSLLSLF